MANGKKQRQHQVSKGQRRSCNKHGKQVQRQEINAERVASAMHNAFANIKVATNITKSKVVNAVLKGLKDNTGNPKVGRGWTANLSPRTVKKLVEEGIFA